MRILGRLLAIGLTIMLFTSCASTSTLGDPFEQANRKSWDFNYQVLDKHVLKPVAVGYEKIPLPIRDSVANVLSNLNEPLYALNNLLQGKIVDSGSTLLRFVLNTIVGIFGVLIPLPILDCPKK